MRKCCKGKRGGILVHTKGGKKRHLTKAQKKHVIKKGKELYYDPPKKGGSVSIPGGSVSIPGGKLQKGKKGGSVSIPGGTLGKSKVRPSYSKKSRVQKKKGGSTRIPAGRLDKKKKKKKKKWSLGKKVGVGLGVAAAVGIGVAAAGHASKKKEDKIWGKMSAIGSKPKKKIRKPKKFGSAFRKIAQGKKDKWGMGNIKLPKLAKKTKLTSIFSPR